jgi:hypothetical protein
MPITGTGKKSLAGAIMVAGALGTYLWLGEGSVSAQGDYCGEKVLQCIFYCGGSQNI